MSKLPVIFGLPSKARCTTQRGRDVPCWWGRNAQHNGKDLNRSALERFNIVKALPHSHIQGVYSIKFLDVIPHSRHLYFGIVEIVNSVDEILERIVRFTWRCIKVSGAECCANVKCYHLTQPASESGWHHRHCAPRNFIGSGSTYCRDNVGWHFSPQNKIFVQPDSHAPWYLFFAVLL